MRGDQKIGFGRNAQSIEDVAGLDARQEVADHLECRLPVTKIVEGWMFSRMRFSR